MSLKGIKQKIGWNKSDAKIEPYPSSSVSEAKSEKKKE